MKKLTAILLALVLAAVLMTIPSLAAGETTVTVTRAEHSPAFEHEFEIDYHFTGLDNPDLCSDAWVGVYPTSLIDEVLAGKNEFKGHSFGSWCVIAGDNAPHGAKLSLGAEADVSHTDGTWGNKYVINEGAENPAIWGGALDTETEYKAVLFRCDEEGYEIVTVSQGFRFVEAVAEESDGFKALKALAETLGGPITAENYEETKNAVERAIKDYGALSELEAAAFPEELYDKISAANYALKQYEDAQKETKAPETKAPETKTPETKEPETETKAQTAPAAPDSTETPSEKKGCGSVLAPIALLPLLLCAAGTRKKK